MATREEIEAAMVAPELRVRPLVDVLVQAHGFQRAAEKLQALYLTEAWPPCKGVIEGGKHTCGKNGCGGTPAELFSAKQIETVRGWHVTCLAAAATSA